MRRAHSMPFGTELLDDGQVQFRLWAPAAEQVELCLEESDSELILPMVAEPSGWYMLSCEQATVGSCYQYRINGELRVPDPASRFQSDGSNGSSVHGPSQVIDPKAWQWDDGDWQGRAWEEAVIYELHVGTFSSEGTFAGVQARLDYLLELGVTAIELMPVAAFPGTQNWGYDGVLLYAPDATYGTPDELKALIQACHNKGLMVFLDVVYNHFGPEGNYLHTYSPQFFTERHHTPWGAAINFDGPDSETVRRFFIDNALYWLEEYHLDGLRLDAVHAIIDDSSPNILEELALAVSQGPGRERPVHLILENDHNAAHYLRRDPQGQPERFVAQWNDDIHHVLHLLLSGEADGYYADYADRPLWYLGRCLTEGFAYQGEDSAYRNGEARGEPSRALPPTAFVSLLQNHDQVGNRAFGERIGHLVKEKPLKAAMAVLLLAPTPPLLFMGEEFASRQPFQFFCDFGDDLAEAVTEGRRREFERFERFADAKIRETIPDPNALSSFRRSKLDWDSLLDSEHEQWLEFYRQLLRLRHKKIIPRLAGVRGEAGEFHLIGSSGLRVQWRLGDGSELILLANMSEAPVPVTPEMVPDGEALYARPSGLAVGLAAHRLPPWSVAWFLLETQS